MLLYPQVALSDPARLISVLHVEVLIYNIVSKAPVVRIATTMCATALIFEAKETKATIPTSLLLYMAPDSECCIMRSAISKQR